MAVREQVVRLTGCEMFIQEVIVFPSARVEAKFGTTRKVQ